MKVIKQMLAIIIALSFLFSVAPAFAGIFSSKTDDAQEKLEKAIGLMAINLNDEASKLINEAKTTVTKELINDPNNNQALFVLAQAETYLNNQKNAKLHFGKACQRDQSLCKDIYSFYEKLAVTHKKMGNPSLMISYRIEACNYLPGARDKLAENFFRDGTSFLKSNNYHVATIYFNASSELNSGYNTAIAVAIRDSAKNLPDPCAQMLLYRYAFNYSPPAMNQELFQFAAQVLKDCNEQSVKKEFNQIRQDYRAVIRNIAYPPDYIEVKDTNFFFIDCVDGKPSKYYRIKGNNVNLTWNSHRAHFYLQLRSGKKITPNDLKKERVYVGSEDFRIVPTKNKPLDVGVKLL